MSEPIRNGTRVFVDGNPNVPWTVSRDRYGIVECWRFNPSIPGGPAIADLFPRHRVETVPEFNQRIADEEAEVEAAGNLLPPLYPG